MVLSGSGGEWQTWPMKSDTPSYHGYRFPPEIISHAVWVSSAKKKIATRCDRIGRAMLVKWVLRPC